LKNRYILIDYENIQPATLAPLNGHPVKIFVFVGANQRKLPLDLVSSLQPFGSNAEYIQIEGNGPNALDFHIAFYIGQLAERDPNACFYIISKDTGFDPLIKHLKTKHISVQRSMDLSGVPLPGKSEVASFEKKVAAIKKSLAARGSARPRKFKTLANTINALFKNVLEETELNSLIDKLKQQQYLAIENENVSYK